MGSKSKEKLATPCPTCHGTGIEPGYRNRVCIKCGGVQYVNKETGEALSDFDALRLAIKLLKIKDFEKQELRTENHRLRKEMASLQPYMDEKAAAELQEKIYPSKRKKERRDHCLGGYGD